MLTPELEVQAVGKRLMEDGEKERWRQKETKQGNGTGENQEEEGVRGGEDECVNPIGFPL